MNSHLAVYERHSERCFFLYWSLAWTKTRVKSVTAVAIRFTRTHGQLTCPCPAWASPEWRNHLLRLVRRQWSLLRWWGRLLFNRWGPHQLQLPVHRALRQLPCSRLAPLPVRRALRPPSLRRQSYRHPLPFLRWAIRRLKPRSWTCRIFLRPERSHRRVRQPRLIVPRRLRRLHRRDRPLRLISRPLRQLHLTTKRPLINRKRVLRTKRRLLRLLDHQTAQSFNSQLLLLSSHRPVPRSSSRPLRPWDRRLPFSQCDLSSKYCLSKAWHLRMILKFFTGPQLLKDHRPKFSRSQVALPLWNAFPSSTARLTAPWSTRPFLSRRTSKNTEYL